MCGFAGIWGYLPSPAERNQIRRCLHSRGPDAWNEWILPEKTGWTGHARLAILDPRERSHQPFFSSHNRTVLLYNGEVYNYRELRARWKPPHGWRTTSDTEVVCEGLAVQEISALSHLDGMFALAGIFLNAEGQVEKILLARDFAGVKPLYYFWDGELFAFASTIPALLSLRPIRMRTHLLPEYLPEYLACGWTPEPLTLLRHIRRVPAGGCILFDPYQMDLNILRWWREEEALARALQHPIRDEGEALTRTFHHIKWTVQTRLRSDVPVGIFLSGGVDSSLLATFALRELNHSTLRAYSLVLEDSAKELPPGWITEEHWMRQIARFLQIPHEIVRVSAHDLLQFAEQLPWILGEPMSDPAIFTMLALSRWVSREVRVVLTGEGADELFRGYGTHRWQKRLQSPIQRFFWEWMVRAIARISSSPFRRRFLLAHFQTSSGTLPFHLHTMEQRLFSWEETLQWTSHPLSHMPPVNVSIPPDILVLLKDGSSRQAWWEWRFYLREDLLVKADRGGMAFHLEIRVPFADSQTLWDLSWRIAPDIHQKRLKHILKQIIESHYPEIQWVTERPKWGFGIPVETWLSQKKNWQELLSLLTPDFAQTWNLRFSLLQQERNRFLASQKESWRASRLWTLIVLALWTHWFRSFQ